MRIALAAAAALLVLSPTAVSASTVDPVFPRGLPAAPTEDSCYVHRCVWDAKHMGDGQGHSVILTRYHGDFLAKRITHRRAHRLLEAWCARPSVQCIGG